MIIVTLLQKHEFSYKVIFLVYVYDKNVKKKINKILYCLYTHKIADYLRNELF